MLGPHQQGSYNLCLSGALANGKEGAKGKTRCLFPGSFPAGSLQAGYVPQSRVIVSPVGSGNDSHVPLDLQVVTAALLLALVRAELFAQGSLAPSTLHPVKGPFIKLSS